MRSLAALATLLFILSLSGCASFGGSAKGEARYDDAAIKTGIASALVKKDVGKATDVNVHCFNGHVFLIGEADEAFRADAVRTASAATGVVHVTTHWFPAGTADTLNDASIEADISAKVNFREDFKNHRVAVDVWGGHVVLTGIVKKQAEIDSAVAKIKAMPHVKSVTSYISLG